MIPRHPIGHVEESTCASYYDHLSGILAEAKLSRAAIQ